MRREREVRGQTSPAATHPWPETPSSGQGPCSPEHRSRKPNTLPIPTPTTTTTRRNQRPDLSLPLSHSDPTPAQGTRPNRNSVSRWSRPEKKKIHSILENFQFDFHFITKFFVSWRKISDKVGWFCSGEGFIIQTLYYSSFPQSLCIYFPNSRFPRGLPQAN